MTKADMTGRDCFLRAAATEPLFTLRASDPVAANTVRDWMRRRTVKLGSTNRIELDKVESAGLVASSMEHWRSIHRTALGCGCDFGVDPWHYCERHGSAPMVEMRAMLEQARDAYRMRVAEFIRIASAIDGAVGEISVDQALVALRREASRIL